MLVGWNRYVTITIPASKVAADLTNFPVYVNLADLPDDFHTHVNQTDARDVRVTLNDGTTEVPREIVSFAAATRSGGLHFKANLSSTTDNIFQIQYDNSSATEPAKNAANGAGNVWNSNYAAVYHMAQNPAGTAPQITDSTLNNRHGTTQGSMVAGNLVDGKMGKAIQFDGANDCVRLPYRGTQGPATVSVWAKPANTTQNTVVICQSADSDPVGSGGWGIILNSQPTAVWGASNITEPPTTQANLANTSEVTTEFTHLAVTWVSGTLKGFKNGVQYDSKPTVGTNLRWSNTTSSIAAYFNNTPSAFFNGILDEVRFLTTNLSQEWLTTEYSNQAFPGSFYSVTMPGYFLTDYTANHNDLIGIPTRNMYFNDFSSTGLGTKWTVNNGTPTVGGGVLTNTDPANNALFYFNDVVRWNGQSIRADLLPQTGDSFIQFILRASSIDTLRANEGYYGYAQYNGGTSYTLQILKNHAGTLNTVLATTTLNLTTNINLKFTAVGSTLTLYANGVQRLQVTDTDITQVGTAVVRLAYNGNQMDNLSFDTTDITRSAVIPSTNVPTNAVVYSTQFGTAPSFLSAVDSASLSITGPITIEAWIYLSQLPSEAGRNFIVLSKTTTNATGLSYLFRIDNPSNKFTYYCWDPSVNASGYQPTSYTVPKNTWFHVALTIPQQPTAAAQYYINGSPIATTVVSGPTAQSINDNALDVQIGNAEIPPSAQLAGNVADVRLWNVERTASQILNNYYQRLVGNETGLVAYYPFSNTPANHPVTIAPQFRGFAKTTNAAPTTTFTITIPSQTRIGDDLYVVAISKGHTGATAKFTCTDNDTGGNLWTEKAVTSDRKTMVFWKKATVGTASKTITIAGCVTSSTGGVTVFSGGANGDPTIDVVIEENASGDESHASFVPTDYDTAICFMLTNDVDNTSLPTLVDAANMGSFEGEVWQATSTAGGGCSAQFYQKPQSGGVATPTGTFTWAQNNTTTDTITFAVSPNHLPIVTLDSPADGATIVDTTPDLLFTGTDANSEDITYEIEIDTSPTFDSAPYIIDEVSFVNQYTIPTPAVTYGLQFKPDGTRFFSSSNSNIQQYNLSTPWAIQTATNPNEFLVRGGQSGNQRGFCFSNDGHVLFSASVSPVAVYQYTLPTAFSMVGGSYSGFSLTTSPLEAATFNCAISPDGHTLITQDFTNRKLYQYNLPVANLLSGVTYTGKNFSTANEDPLGLVGMWISPDGLHAYLCGSAFFIFQYDFGTAWDVSTLKYSGISYQVFNELPYNVALGNNGENLYISHYASQIVEQFNIGGPMIYANSSIHPGFTASGDTDPFTSGNQVTYTVQNPLDTDLAYYWKVKGRNSFFEVYGNYSPTFSFNYSAPPPPAILKMFGDEGLVQ